MRRMLGIACIVVCSVGVALRPVTARAWGATGHRLVGREAVLALPPDLPAFLRPASAADAVGELAREPDRWKDAGKAHDADRDPAHFVDVGDDGSILGGPALANLPETRAGYDAALRIAGVDSWKAGYLPYAIIDAWQQLAKDFAYWRVDDAAAGAVADPAHRAWFVADRAARQALVLRDLGVLAHYVGDGSQPLHVTIHFNGWGPWPNPEGFTQERIHAAFEGEFVRSNIVEQDVRDAMTPYADCQCDIVHWTSAYLAAGAAEVAPLYRLRKDGAFMPGDARGRDFVTKRLAAGASALRDVIVAAWRQSARGHVGWPSVPVADVEAARVDPYDSLYGVD